MTLRASEGVLGAPWHRGLRGTFEQLVVESEALAGNPLGDPTRRPLYVYLPPGADRGANRRYPAIYVLQGFTGQLDMWFNRTAFEPSMPERVDDLFSTPGVPPALVVFVDAWTSVGGSQFINSPAGTGRYMDYLCDEIVPFVDDVYPTAASRDRRGLAGKSSGGYGAMVVSMMRPDVFGALASHAGDALFEVCYAPGFRAVARRLRDSFEGSYEVMLERFRAGDRAAMDDFTLVETYGYALCYSPDATRQGTPMLPFDIATGALVDDVWQQWLAWDPVRMASGRSEALATMKLIYLDAGRSDEYYLDLGATAFSRELEALGIRHTLDLFEGRHAGLQHRYPGALRVLAETLSED